MRTLFLSALLAFIFGLTPAEAQNLPAAAAAVKETAASAETAAASGAAAKPAVALSPFRTRNTEFGKSGLGSELPDFSQAAGKTSKVTFYLVAVILSLLYGYKQIKLRNQPLSDQSLIEILARKSVSSKTALIIVKAEERKFLLSQNGDDLSLLADLGPSANFAEGLSQLSFFEENPSPAQAANG